MIETRIHRFVGMNIKGNPAMSAKKVRSDVKVAKSYSDVAVFQEFRWDWYWKALGKALPSFWGTSPGRKHGEKHPVMAAQAVLWNRRRWKKIDTRTILLHTGKAKVSETRYLRAVLLEDRKAGLRAWFVTTHFVVGGDEAKDSPLRKKMLRGNQGTLDAFLRDLKDTGYAVICQLDANIRRTSSAYDGFMLMLRSLSANIHGAHGVEFLFTIDGPESAVKVVADWQISTSKLNTDHEGRGISFRLRG